MLIVNLNIRGLGGSTKARYLRQIIACEGVKFMCLQETKIVVLSEAGCFSLWGDNKVGWLHYSWLEVCCQCGIKKLLVTIVM